MNNNQTIDITNFRLLASKILEAKLPVMVRGAHGIGKSEIVYQIGKAMGFEFIVEIRASQMTEGDTLGIPNVNIYKLIDEKSGMEKESTNFTSFEWLTRACVSPCLLFFDEIDRAVREVRQSLMQLVDSRKMANHVLHPDTIVVSAINGGNNQEKYDVNEMDPAELSRWFVFDLDPTVEEWIAWAKGNGVTKEIVSFISVHNKHLEHTGKFEPNKVYPSRRSWVRFSKVLGVSDFVKSKNFDAILRLGMSIVGAEASLEFKQYLADCKVDWRIFFDNKVSEVPGHYFTLEMPEHAELINMLKDSKDIGKKMNDTTLGKFLEYIKNAPVESMGQLISVITVANKENFFEMIKKDPDLMKKYLPKAFMSAGSV